MRSDEAYAVLGGYGPFDGGCLEIARAALRISDGGVLWVTGPLGATADHVFVVHEGRCWDGDGGHSTAQMVEKVRREGNRGAVAFHTRRFHPDEVNGIPDDPAKVDLLAALLAAALEGTTPGRSRPTRHRDARCR